MADDELVTLASRAIFKEHEPALYAQEDRGTRLWLAVMDQSREAAAAALVAVRDQIAAEALVEAALAIDSGDADHEELRQGGIDEIWPKGWSKASVIAARDVGSVWADWLRARADRLDPEEPEPTPEEIRQRQVDDADDQQAERYER